ncbi:MAG: bsaA [Myxococcaceae bacterium]|nr:bsaA [Myxococcaceae bacterium]
MTTLHEFKLPAIDGAVTDLATLRGKAVLVVNVASRCGYTPQYAGLQKLQAELGPRGFTVLGVPANEFGAQEPGTDGEIQSFCETNYGVTFPMLGKIVVKGPGQHPLYQWLTSAAAPAGDVKWNFEKFLINGRGEVVGRFGSGVAPESAELRSAIEAALG